MKIGYLVPEFPSQTHAFFWREAEGLESAGVTVQFLSTREPNEWEARHAFVEEARERTIYLFPPPLGATARVLARRPGRTAKALGYLARLRESSLAQRARAVGLLPSAAALVAVARRERLDHLHIHSFANAAHLGALANILDDLPYSLTLHGDLPVYGTDHVAKTDRAAFVTAVTSPLQRQIREQIPGREAHVISMGVDIDVFTPPAAPRPDGPLRIGSVARLNPVKGHVYLLDAMAELVAAGLDLEYEIAGDGPHRSEIVTRIEQLGLGDRVRLLGNLSEAEVVDLLERIDVFALTSFGLGEAAPVAVMEAMACGLPVICSRIGGTGDMIRDGETGLLVAQQDVPAIRSALERLATDDAFRSRLGEAARTAAVETFDHRRRAAMLADVLRESAIR